MDIQGPLNSLGALKEVTYRTLWPLNAFYSPSPKPLIRADSSDPLGGSQRPGHLRERIVTWHMAFYALLIARWICGTSPHWPVAIRGKKRVATTTWLFRFVILGKISRQ